MTDAIPSRLSRQLEQALSAEPFAHEADHELLERFLATRDGGAFQALVLRHGPMVYRVCRRVIPSEHDAEDAFQTTFLVLARKAGTIRKRTSLASWLHGVANRTALEARAASGRRRKHETRVAGGTEQEPGAGLADERTWKELRSVLDAELEQLPEDLRAPLVLCYLQGMTQDEAALELETSKATLRRNLERGRELLAARLTRRGVTLSAALFAVLLSEGSASAAPSPKLIGATVDAAARLAETETIPGVRSADAAGGAIKMILLVNSKGAAGILAVVAVLGTALILGAHRRAEVRNDQRDRDPTRSQAGAGDSKGAAASPMGGPVDAPRAPEVTGEAVAMAAAATGTFEAESNPVLQSVLLLANRPAVLKEIGLSAVDARKVSTLTREFSLAMEAAGESEIVEGFQQLPNLNQEQREKAQAELEEKLEALNRNADDKLRRKLEAILSPAQFRRIRQIRWQGLGMLALSDFSLASELDVTGQQQARIDKIISGAAEARRKLLVIGKAYPPDEYRAVTEKMATLTKNRDAELSNVLTETQMKKFAELKGAKFDLETLTAP